MMDVQHAAITFRPDGHFGKLLDKMVANHVEATDPVWLANLMRDRTKDGWQSEFWGKYMHAAVPLCRYTGSKSLGAKIAAGVRTVLDLQEADGYIGNYAPENRYGLGWDVWGTKYTLLGLLHYYDWAAAQSMQNAECRMKAVEAVSRRPGKSWKPPNDSATA